MFVKVFRKIHDSTIADDYMLRFVFMDLLILADRKGIVDMTEEAVARRTNVPIEVVRAMIKRLGEPDPASNHQEFEGRRILPLSEGKPWGWRIVNYEYYRNVRSEEELRAQTRERVQRFRERRNNTPQPESQTNGVADGESIPSATRKYEEARVVLHYLNEKAGRRFREVGENLDWISARLGEPDVTVEGVKQMIDRQVAKWKGDPKMDEYLRPATLFAKTNFSQYYDMRDVPVLTGNGGPLRGGQMAKKGEAF